ncbi:ABR025Cp [Eremothecium gossypii ATCC 10895]|uniref:ABR025Cp n=1 Tax=Eremothecium gossypii (strain ATCC 10895 / CBS 109.51 / FGSC 9923 / NRRL Y-1056) TaxID=284811 RepID=Q75DJ7_EREGS|nr:ABR025Cp [Eremothecium gossypii ATCC 10895]AAS50795.2 ABR025Cp [Eremothecium gossypii ATCC 10895]AEY95084.1 FABR025Cp [Eremothecium gossypii FDAG1]
MKVFSGAILGLTALAKMVLADSEAFYFLSIRSASMYHMSSVFEDNGALKLGGSTADALSAVVTDDGKLKLSNGHYAVVDAKGAFTAGSADKASTGFSISRGYVTYKGNSGFYPVGSSSPYELTLEQPGATSISVALRAQSVTGASSVDDFEPAEGAARSAAPAAGAGPAANATAPVANGTAPATNGTAPAGGFANVTVTATGYHTVIQTITSCENNGGKCTVLTTTGPAPVPVSTAPGSSAPHSSAPVSSAPVSSAPHSSAPHSSAPSTSASSTIPIETQTGNGAAKAVVGLGAGVLAAAAMLI